MDLKQLQYFVVCAQTGSFSDAAKVLYSTQPSVSKVVKALEDALGMQLFERLPRGIRLTVQGQKVYQYACRITNEIRRSGKYGDAWYDKMDPCFAESELLVCESVCGFL